MRGGTFVYSLLISEVGVVWGGGAATNQHRVKSLVVPDAALAVGVRYMDHAGADQMQLMKIKVHKESSVVSFRGSVLTSEN